MCPHKKFSFNVIYLFTDDYYNGKPNGNIPNGGHHHPHLHQQHQQHQQQHQQQQPHSTYLYDNNTNVQRERSFKGDGSSNPGQTRRERVDSGSYNVQNNRHNPGKILCDCSYWPTIVVET